MLEGEIRSQMEQGQALFVEYLPPLWKGLYEGCKKEGFSEASSLELVKAYIMGQCPGGIKP